MTNKGLCLNASKTKSMLIHSRRQKLETGLSIHVDGMTVEQVQVHKYLGVVLNDALTWSDHIDMVCGKVNRSLNLLRRLFWFLPSSLLPSISNIMSFPTSITVMLYGQAALKKNHVGWNPFSTSGVRLFFQGNVTLPPLLLSRNLDRRLSL